MPAVDLNSDLGEGFGTYTSADDEAMLDIVSSANVACGFHAGDPHIMANIFALAKAKSVAIGAHPGYRDLWGFGRRVLPHTLAEVEQITAYQIGAALALANLSGHRITFVKPHGALGNLADGNPEVATVVARAIRAVNPHLILVATALGCLVKAGEDHSLRVVHEIFADRTYAEDGQLLPRSLPGSIVTDPELALARTLHMLEAGGIITQKQNLLTTPIDTICVHGDTPHAVAMARALKDGLLAKGFVVEAFAP
ncbi:5-oxoprolinase subunit PxpA [Bradyrhizobium sp. BWA-3-5]|uniref:LamB/YcsF family protein n=1 Tax=Bradyrhizobium sp. BWA-3-5 TaxID=3080013 RepID=UPI00293E3015|nr:5-oxoprolinase subunit PxpA [Bradyrhizobium sp. BWA-3-5]WOH63735.1 5-oxoprolinase subunit PxpA [Bradyrhizobium sp. BWA-3-5]